MILTVQQKQLIQDLLEIVKDSNFGRKYLFSPTVGGFAGTGKTTIICELRKQLENMYINTSVAFVTFTGKASSVLKTKLQNSDALYNNDYCGTIHGLIYQPKTKWDTKLKTYVVVGWKRREPSDIRRHVKLIIIDEASMVSKQTWKDLISYEIPIIAFGDHGQLPPIGDDFGFQLMKSPEFTLTEIHRQALNSPIIKLSKFIRDNGYIPFGIYSPGVFKLSWRHPQCKKQWNGVSYADNNLQILCGFNQTRANLNDNIRTSLGYNQKAPYPDEKIVCLSNNHTTKIMNGQIGKVMWLMPGDDAYRITVDIDNEVYECYASDQCFGEVQYTMHDKSSKLKKSRYSAMDNGFANLDFFDYGYVISVHKSQGSEWEKIILFEQRTKRWDDEYYAKWLYTAVTRARTKLFVIADAWI